MIKKDKYKTIITEALKFLVTEGKVTVYGFVIMSNHRHIISQSKSSNNIQKVQNNFIKHTSKEFKKQLERANMLTEYEVNAIDRKHNFWKPDLLNIELFTASVFSQKLNYIHYNPVKAGLYNLPEEYHFSSALSYEKGIDKFCFVEHYMGNGL